MKYLLCSEDAVPAAPVPRDCWEMQSSKICFSRRLWTGCYKTGIPLLPVVSLAFLVCLIYCVLPFFRRSDTILLLYNPSFIRNLIPQVQNRGLSPSFNPLFLYKTVLCTLGHNQSMVLLLMEGHCIQRGRRFVENTHQGPRPALSPHLNTGSISSGSGF